MTDKIRIQVEDKQAAHPAMAYAGYIAAQTQAEEVLFAAEPAGAVVVDSDIDGEPVRIAVTKL